EGEKARSRKTGARKKAAPKRPAAKKAARAVTPKKAKAVAPIKITVSGGREAAVPAATPAVAAAPPKRKAPVRRQSGTVAPRQERPTPAPYYITTPISYPNS